MIIFNTETDFDLKPKRFYKKWLQKLINNEGFRVGEVSYIFCDDAYLLPINQQYLNHDTLTDIITFDYVEGVVLSGDIYISIERVCENAKIYNVSFDDELIRVLAHGVLHLCGYKDKSEGDAKEMRGKEEMAIALCKEMAISCNI